MIKEQHVRYLGIAFLLIGLVVALVLGFYRGQAEKANDTVEILIDYEQLKILSLEDQIPLATLAAQFREKGATGVIVRESTLADREAAGSLMVWRGTELALQQKINKDFLPEIAPLPENFYLLITDEVVLAEVYPNLLHKKAGVTLQETAWGSLLTLRLSGSEWEKLGVGFPRADLNEINKGGLGIVPRVRTWSGVKPEAVALLSSTWQDLPGLTLLTFNDDLLPGEIGYLGQCLQGLSVPVGTFEFYEQQGLSSLARSLGKNAVRIHCLNENELSKSNEKEALERFNLAVAERNIRALYVRFLGMAQPHTALQKSLAFIGAVKNGVEAQGLAVGSAKKLAAIPYSRVLVFLVGLGVLGGGLLFLRLFLKPQHIIVLSGLALLGLAAFLYQEPLLTRKMLALLAVILFPVLAMLTWVRTEARTVGQAIWALLGLTAFSLAGALLLVGLLADKSFLLRLDQFSGVKVAHIVPLFFVPLYFLYRENREGFGVKLKKGLQTPLLAWHVLVAFGVVVLLAVYLLRTGNSVPGLVSTWEIKFREILRAGLGVRPRTKEFLLGHPFLFLLLLKGYQPRRLPLLLLGTIGQVSVVNTYAHLHTPLLISLLRTGHGLWLGILGGLVFMLVTTIFSRRLKNG